MRATLDRVVTGSRGGGAHSWSYTRNTICQIKVSMTAGGVVEDTDHDH